MSGGSLIKSFNLQKSNSNFGTTKVKNKFLNLVKMSVKLNSLSGSKASQLPLFQSNKLHEQFHKTDDVLPHLQT